MLKRKKKHLARELCNAVQISGDRALQAKERASSKVLRQEPLVCCRMRQEGGTQRRVRKGRVTQAGG